MTKEGKTSTLEDLLNYQYLHVAGEKAKTDPVAAMVAVRKHYSKYKGEYLIDLIMERASIGVSEGRGISDDAVLKAIKHGHDNYKASYDNAKVGDIIESVKIAGYKDIPKELYDYKDIKYSDLIKKVEAKDEDAKKAATALMVLEHYKMEKLYTDALKDMTTENLERIYSKTDKKDKED
jgi:hypothetical protein